MQPHAERVVDELKRVVAEAQDLLHQGGNRADEARSALAERVANARDRVISMERLAARRARDTADEVDRYAHEHPWQVAGIGLAAALAVVLVALLVIESHRE